jgi:UDP-glucose 4-epimerase
MKCFITGATGFLGSFLVRHLLAEGHEVHAMIRNPEPEACWRIADLMPQIQVVAADLNHLDRLDDVLPGMRPDVIFHLAWNGVGSEARNSPVQLIQNVSSTLKMLELCHLSGCPVFLGLGSQAEYGIAQGVLDEASACNPVTAYGVAKTSLSLLATKFGEITKTRILWFRLFSAYGPKDDPNHLLPDLIVSLLNGACPPLTLGEQKWDYLYVEDAVEALVAAAMSPNAHGIFNLASGEVHSLRDVIESARNEIDPDIVLQFGELPYRPDQVMHLEGKVSRLKCATGWRPQVSLADGLKRTVAWYKEAKSIAQQE